MSRSGENLWSHVLDGSTESVCDGGFVNCFFAKAEICQLNVTLEDSGTISKVDMVLDVDTGKKAIRQLPTNHIITTYYIHLAFSFLSTPLIALPF